MKIKVISDTHFEMPNAQAEFFVNSHNMSEREIKQFYKENN